MTAIERSPTFSLSLMAEQESLELSKVLDLSFQQLSPHMKALVSNSGLKEEHSSSYPYLPLLSHSNSKKESKENVSPLSLPSQLQLTSVRGDDAPSSLPSPCHLDLGKSASPSQSQRGTDPYLPKKKRKLLPYVLVPKISHSASVNNRDQDRKQQRKPGLRPRPNFNQKQRAASSSVVVVDSKRTGPPGQKVNANSDPNSSAVAAALFKQFTHNKLKQNKSESLSTASDDRTTIRASTSASTSVSAWASNRTSGIGRSIVERNGGRPTLGEGGERKRSGLARTGRTGLGTNTGTLFLEPIADDVTGTDKYRHGKKRMRDDDGETNSAPQHTSATIDIDSIGIDIRNGDPNSRSPVSLELDRHIAANTAAEQYLVEDSLSEDEGRSSSPSNSHSESAPEGAWTWTSPPRHAYVLPPSSVDQDQNKSPSCQRERASLLHSLNNLGSNANLEVWKERNAYVPPEGWRELTRVPGRSPYVTRSETPAQRYTEILEQCYGPGDIRRGHARKPHRVKEVARSGLETEASTPPTSTSSEGDEDEDEGRGSVEAGTGRKGDGVIRNNTRAEQEPGPLVSPSADAPMDDPLVLVPDILADEPSLSANDPSSASAPIVVDLHDTNKDINGPSTEELEHQRHAMKVRVPERERELDLGFKLASAPTPNGIVDPRTLTRSVPSTATADEDSTNASRAPSISSATITATKTAPSASVFLRETDTSEANYSVLASPELAQGTKGLANNKPPADETSSRTSRIFVEREEIPRSNGANHVNDNSVPRSGSRREDSAGANIDEGQGVNANSAPSTDADAHIHTGAGSPPSPTAGPIEESTGMPEGNPPVHQIRWFNTEEWKGTFRRFVSGKKKTVTIDDLMNVDRTLAALEEIVSALASIGDDKDSVKALVEIVKEYLMMMKDLPDGFIPFDDQFGLRRRSAYLLQVAYGQT